MEISKVLKNGCMGCLLVLGVMILISTLLMVSGIGSDSSDNQQPFEVMTKKGVVKLHLGMPKDSLVLLVGKPDDIKSHSVGNTVIVEYGYKVKEDYLSPDLKFTFEDGKLREFSQY